VNLSKSALSLMAAVAAAAFPFAAPAQDKPVELRYATVAPQKSIWGTQLERYAKTLDEESGGTVRMQMFFGGQLGAENEIVKQVATGRLDAGGVGLVFASTLVPELQLLTLPMYFKDQAELDCVIDTAMTRPVTERLAAKGVQLYGWGEAGSVHFIGRKPYVAPSDVAGTKAGTFGTRQGQLFWQALGANTAPTSTTEMASGLQTGLIDLTVTVPVFYVAAGINKIAPVITRSDLYFLPTVALMNKSVWDRLSPAQQQSFRRVVQKLPPSLIRQEVREFEGRMLAVHEKGGGQVAVLTPEQREAFRRAVAPMWPRMVQEAGPEGPRFFELLEAGRRACEKKA
jgi:TRAP-type transport system periplasmic protein